MQRIVKGIIMLGLLGAFLIMGVNQASADPLSYQTARIYGSDRIETAIKVAQQGWTAGAKTVLIARQDTFPDALAAVPLSVKLDAPILLTDSKQLDGRVSDEIKALKPTQVILLGSEGALSKEVYAQISLLAPQVTRIDGKDRYDTARIIANQVGGNGSAILVSGENYPDALAVAPYAGIAGIPILLTPNKTLDPITKQALSELNVATLTVIGSEAVVSNQTVSATGIPGGKVVRWAGSDRYETASKVYTETKATFTANQAYLASGETYPDALTGGALAAKVRAPLFLTSSNVLPAITFYTLEATSNLTKIFILGSPQGAVSANVEMTIKGEITPNYFLGGLSIVLDPGHGTPYSGAVGYSKNTLEKDVNLAIAQKLATLLRSVGARVYLTRTGDASPDANNDLWARVDMANNLNADLFISIHSNGGPAQAHGTETYCGSLNEFNTYSESYKLAALIQDKLVKNIGLTNRGVKDGDFTVLNHTKMPAVLVEVAFISNPTEEKLLADDSFRQKAATGIYQGVLAYKGF